MPSTSVLVNHTLAAPLNATERSVNLNTTLFPHLKSFTAIPFNNTTWYSISNTSSIHNPYYPGYITIGPPLISYSYTYSYAYYAFLLLLLIAAIICIKIGMSRRKELEQRAAAQRRRALQQVENAYVPTNSDNNSNNTSTSVKDFDLPPKYEDVVQPSAENTPVGNTICTTNPSSRTLPPAISTLTIETEISNSTNSVAVNINNHSISQ